VSVEGQALLLGDSAKVEPWSVYGTGNWNWQVSGWIWDTVVR
jgi:hypothetical protein